MKRAATDSIRFLYPHHGDGIRLAGNRLRVQHIGTIRVCLHRGETLSLVIPFAFHIDESERFPANTRTILAARDHMNGRHTALFKATRPHPKRFRSDKVYASTHVSRT
jgi:hypothetical protein